MDIQMLKEFLVRANTSTYANKQALKAISTRLGSEDYHYEEGDYMYHDTYFGGKNFIGEEIVYETLKPVWGMNYLGYVFSEQRPVGEIYDFLRKALMVKYDDIIPVRGPKNFNEGQWVYTNEPAGSLDRFVGKEEIYYEGTLLYRCDYHGGFIG